MNDAQNQLNSSSQTLNPQSNVSSTLQQPNSNLQNSNQTNLNISGAYSGIVLGASSSQAVATTSVSTPPKNYTPYFTAGIVIILATIASIIFMRWQSK